MALAALGVLGLIIVGKTWVFDAKKDGQSAPSSSAAAGPPTPAEAAPPTPAGPKKPDGVTFTTAPGPNGDVVDARFAIRDNYTEQMIKDGARTDT